MKLKNALKKEIFSYRKMKVARNFEKCTCINLRLKTLVKDTKCTEEMRTALICKENSEACISCIKNLKPISKKVASLEDIYMDLNTSDEKNTILLDIYFFFAFIRSYFFWISDLDGTDHASRNNTNSFIRCLRSIIGSG